MNAYMKPATPLMPLASRRRLVMTGAVGLLMIFVSLFMQATDTTTSAWKIMAIFGILLMVYGWARFTLPSYSGLPQLNQPGLDERQQQVVTKAYAYAYRLLAFGVMMVGLYVMFTDLFPGLPELKQMVDKSMLLLALMWTVIGLPTAVLAWNEPDEIE